MSFHVKQLHVSKERLPQDLLGRISIYVIKIYILRVASWGQCSFHFVALHWFYVQSVAIEGENDKQTNKWSGKKNENQLQERKLDLIFFSAKKHVISA